MSKRIKLLVITIFLLLFILWTQIAAGSLNTKETANIPVMSDNMLLNQDKALNDAEKVLLSLLTSDIYVKTAGNDLEKGSYEIYMKYLQNFLNRQDVDLTTSQAYAALDKIMELKAIIKIEQESEFNKMSLDGRELAVKLSKEIYHICGLKLCCDIQGNITRITDHSGNYIYLNGNEVQAAGIHLNALLITLVILLVLLSVCFLLAKKHQLFIKDVTYDGFQEGFVQ